MSSVIRGGDNFDSAIGSALKMWVNYNAIGVVTIRDSHGISSITDTGVGLQIIHFLSPRPNTNYACVLGCTSSGPYGRIYEDEANHSKTVSSVGIAALTGVGTLVDTSTINVAVFH